MSYVNKLTQISGFSTELARASNVIGVGDGSGVVSKIMTAARNEARFDVGDGIGTIAGAAAGAIYGQGHRHPWLGAIGGSSLGRNLPALLKPTDRRVALCNLGETGLAIMFSRASPRHPVWAFLIGRVLGGAVTRIGGLRGT